MKCFQNTKQNTQTYYDKRTAYYVVSDSYTDKTAVLPNEKAIPVTNKNFQNVSKLLSTTE